MPSPEPGAALFASLNLRSLSLLGLALIGYLVVMWTNPAHASFRDGIRAVRRYRGLWLIPGAFGFCAALFQLGQRFYFAQVLPPDERPVFRWARAAWRDPDFWLTGSDASLWWLPRADFIAGVRQSFAPAFESLASLFNCLVATFPISALGALLFLLNRGGHQGVLFGALRKRFGIPGYAVHLAILVCALAALTKPLLYVAPQFLHLTAEAATAWFQWTPLIAWLSFLYEYLFGIFVQTCLVLLAFIWVRGLTFTRSHLIDFAIRRFSFALKWAAVILLFSAIFIDAPVLLRHFPAFAGWFPDDPELFAHRLAAARLWLALLAIAGSTMQVTLVFHNESWRAALRDHRKFLAQHWLLFAWFLIVAGLHLVALQILNFSIARGVGEGTALWIAWSLLFPWIAGLAGGWLLASWVCVYKCFDTPRRPAAALQTTFKF